MNIDNFKFTNIAVLENKERNGCNKASNYMELETMLDRIPDNKKDSREDRDDEKGKA